MTSKKKRIFLYIVIVLMGLLIVGGTYALLSTVLNVTNGNYMSGTSCFNIVYDITNEDGTSDITGVLFPSKGPKGGLSGSASLSIDSSCNLRGIGNLNLNVVSGSDILFQTVDAHCEDSRTLETMSDYTSEATCVAQNNGLWVTNGTALKYAIYDSDYSTPVSVGYLNSTGTINVLSDLLITSDKLEYDIYVWLDGNLSNQTYVDQLFNANISASVEQTQEERQSYAVYSADDNSLRFYNTADTITQGEKYNNLTVTAVYTDIESSQYTSSSLPPWSTYSANITTVVVEDYNVKPLYTSYWFNNFTNVTSMNLTKLNMTNVNQMNNMFYGCSSLTNLDLSSFKTPKVNTTHSMFYGCSNLINLDISNFDARNVVYMDYMFYNCSKLTILNLSSFGAGKVTSMNSMFYGCSSLKTLYLNNFDTSKAKSMHSMFYNCSSLISLDLSSFTMLSTGSVNLYQWFYGCSSLKFLNMSSIDFSKVSGYWNAFYNVPSDCSILVSDSTQKTWLTGKFSTLTNINTVN